jgi:hypothetical protein
MGEGRGEGFLGPEKRDALTLTLSHDYAAGEGI